MTREELQRDFGSLQISLLETIGNGIAGGSLPQRTGERDSFDRAEALEAAATAYNSNPLFHTRYWNFLRRGKRIAMLHSIVAADFTTLSQEIVMNSRTLFVLLVLLALSFTACTDDSEQSPPSDADMEYELDGDREAEKEGTTDGDNFTDGDTETDVEQTPDGDTIVDGDLIIDGDLLPDGDAETDGDSSVDGDIEEEVETDGDSPIDGDVIVDGDTPADEDRIIDGDSPADEDSIIDGDTPADGDQGIDGDVVTDGDIDGDAEEEVLSCDLVEGLNSDFLVDGEARRFYLALPEGEGPHPVIFNWHGYTDTAANMHSFLSPYINSETYAFILVTPEDTSLEPLSGLDWEILTTTTANKEAALFDAIMECLDSEYLVDWDRLHSVGVSAGGIMTDLLGTLRGDVLASVISFSGGYLGNPANANQTMNMVSWPDFTGSHPYAQLFTHGGVTDTFDLSVVTIHFDQMAANDVIYLNDRGHDTIICDHGTGHDVPEALRGTAVLEFLRDHPYNVTDSPYAEGLPESFPDYCEFSEKTTER